MEQPATGEREKGKLGVKTPKDPTKRATASCDNVDFSGIHRGHKMKPVLKFLSRSFGSIYYVCPAYSSDCQSVNAINTCPY